MWAMFTIPQRLRTRVGSEVKNVFICLFGFDFYELEALSHKYPECGSIPFEVREWRCMDLTV